MSPDSQPSESESFLGRVVDFFLRGDLAVLLSLASLLLGAGASACERPSSQPPAPDAAVARR